MYLQVHRIIDSEEQRVRAKVENLAPKENAWFNRAGIPLKDKDDRWRMPIMVYAALGIRSTNGHRLFSIGC